MRRDGGRGGFDLDHVVSKGVEVVLIESHLVHSEGGLRRVERRSANLSIPFTTALTLSSPHAAATHSTSPSRLLLFFNFFPSPAPPPPPWLRPSALNEPAESNPAPVPVLA
jgi:hypothetical protein